MMFSILDMSDVQQLVWAVIGFNIFLLALLFAATREPKAKE